MLETKNDPIPCEDRRVPLASLGIHRQSVAPIESQSSDKCLVYCPHRRTPSQSTASDRANTIPNI